MRIQARLRPLCRGRRESGPWCQVLSSCLCSRQMNTWNCRSVETESAGKGRLVQNNGPVGYIEVSWACGCGPRSGVHRYCNVPMILCESVCPVFILWLWCGGFSSMILSVVLVRVFWFQWCLQSQQKSNWQETAPCRWQETAPINQVLLHRYKSDVQLPIS